MTPDFVMRLGWAAGRVLASQGGRRRVLIGKDTRVSGYMFESALEAGFSAAGIDVGLLGPIPTPAVACLVRELGAQAGVVISASHNPYYDNGIKFFSAEGRKLPDDIEIAIEEELAASFETVDSAELGKAARINDAAERYIEFCRGCTAEPLSLEGLHIAFDGANGAGYAVGPKLLESLGARVTQVGCEPDGLNINRDVGSTHIDALVRAVTGQGADVGIALDGDGDRVMLVDANGRCYDGDELIYIIAMHRKSEGRLRGPVVGTLMTNLAVEQALRSQGIDFHRAKVGDRYVLEMLAREGGEVGGESSGHILVLDCATTGDGLVAALQVLEAMQAQGRPLDELLDGVEKFPQAMINLRVSEKPDLEAQVIVDAVSRAEAALADAGRVLLRPSGTEPVIRVMVEGQDRTLVEQQAGLIAKAVEAAAREAAKADEEPLG